MKHSAVPIGPDMPEPVIADNMRIYWDVPIKMDDGNVLRADLFLPVEEGRYPVILSSGPYAKGLSFQEGYSSAWNIMAEKYPDSVAGSSNKYQVWEVVDPEKWVPDGYACLRIDCRGQGRSPGYYEAFSPREIRDVHDCIEWAGAQSWSNGKVGMNGISYYAITQWYVARLQPPSLAAICAWEGCNDMYREMYFTAGILNEMTPNVFDMQITPLQHGRGENGPRSAVTGELVCGDETLTEEQLRANRFSAERLAEAYTMDSAFFRERSANFDRTTVPLLSAGNWGGQPFHTRGNVEAFTRSASTHKWLEMHGGEHWTEFYTDYGVGLQKRFFDHFLKDEDNGWDKKPPVQLQIRHPGEKFVCREETAWPIPRTKWTKVFLDPDQMSLAWEPGSAAATTLTYDAMGEGLTFRMAPLAEEMEITGPSAMKMRISSSTEDADIFVVLRLYDPDGREVLFNGALDPKTPVAQGWLRASHRKLDPELSEPYRPYHAHDERQPLSPGEPVDLDIEIWPTSIVAPAGYQLAVTLLGRDFEHDEEPAYLNNIKYPMKGCGPFTHTEIKNRPPEVFGGRTTIHFDEDARPYVLLPVIPSSAE